MQWWYCGHPAEAAIAGEIAAIRAPLHGVTSGIQGDLVHLKKIPMCADVAAAVGQRGVNTRLRLRR